MDFEAFETNGMALMNHIFINSPTGHLGSFPGGEHGVAVWQQMNVK